jgi:hypothetical protein
MLTPPLHQKIVLVVCILISNTLNADSFSGGTGWGKLAQVLLSVSTCQNRLLETERAACFKRNARQACQYAPEGIEKENCIKEYSAYSVPSDTDPSKNHSGPLQPLTEHVPNIFAPSTKTEKNPHNSKTDEFDSRIKDLLYPPSQRNFNQGAIN